MPSPDIQTRLRRLVLRHGQRRSLFALTAFVALVAVLISQVIVVSLGRGDRVLAVLVPFVTSLLVTPVVGGFILKLAFELEQARQQLAELATKDDLTGIANRRHFMQQVQREWDLARRHGSAGALLLIDADGFKRINDTYGHACGDLALRELAGAIGGSLRQVDVHARFGGEEFVVFLPHTDTFGALDVAERIRQKVEAGKVEWNGQAVAMTVSIGVAPIRAELPSLDWMIHEADTALYAAKAAGRNCVRTLEFERNAAAGELRSFKT